MAEITNQNTFMQDYLKQQEENRRNKRKNLLAMALLQNAKDAFIFDNKPNEEKLDQEGIEKKRMDLNLNAFALGVPEVIGNINDFARSGQGLLEWEKEKLKANNFIKALPSDTTSLVQFADGDKTNAISISDLLTKLSDKKSTNPFAKAFQEFKDDPARANFLNNYINENSLQKKESTFIMPNNAGNVKKIDPTRLSGVKQVEWINKSGVTIKSDNYDIFYNMQNQQAYINYDKTNDKAEAEKVTDRGYYDTYDPEATARIQGSIEDKTLRDQSSARTGDGNKGEFPGFNHVFNTANRSSETPTEYVYNNETQTYQRPSYRSQANKSIDSQEFGRLSISGVWNNNPNLFGMYYPQIGSMLKTVKSMSTQQIKSNPDVQQYINRAFTEQRATLERNLKDKQIAATYTRTLREAIAADRSGNTWGTLSDRRWIIHDYFQKNGNTFTDLLSTKGYEAALADIFNKTGYITTYEELESVRAAYIIGQ